MNKQRLMSRAEIWEKAFEFIGQKHAEVFMEAEKAAQEYPLLVACFRLLHSYMKLDSEGAICPDPEPDPGGKGPPSPIRDKSWWPEWLNIPEPWEVGSAEIPELGVIYTELPSCEELRAAYGEALKCCLEYSSKDVLTDEEREKWEQCQEDVSKYWNSLTSRGCLD